MNREQREKEAFRCIDLLQQDMGDSTEFRQIVQLEWSYHVVAAYGHEKAPDNCLRQFGGGGR